MSRFKEVLDLPDGIWNDRSFSDNEIKTIQTALHIANALQPRPIEEAPFNDSEIYVLLSEKIWRHAYHYQDSYGKHVSPIAHPWDNSFDGYATHFTPLPDKVLQKFMEDLGSKKRKKENET